MMAGDYVRRSVAEFVGTFALIFVGAGAVAFARTTTDIALANGLVIAVMVSAVGMTSGGFFNPAITLGLVVARRIATPLAPASLIAPLVSAAPVPPIRNGALPSPAT